MAGNGWKWLGMVGVAGNAWKRLEMARNGSKWLEMARTD